MDRSAIEAITEQPTLIEINKYLHQQGLPVITLPDNSTLNRLETYQHKRTRFRGEMETASLEDFAEYVKNHTDDNGSACFINADQMSATAIFNFGDKDTPGHCDNTATLSLVKTVGYKAALNLDNRASSQRDFSEWLDDWSYCLTAFDETQEPMELKKAIQGIRNISVDNSQEQNHEESNFRAKRSTLETVEVNCKGNPPPALLVFRVVPYDTFQEYDISLRVSVLTGGSAPRVVARIVALETLQQDIAKEFQDKVDQEIKSFIKTYIGQFTA